MTHLEILTEAFTKCDMEFYTRVKNGYTYLRFGEEDPVSEKWHDKFIEFSPDGSLASY